MKPPSLRTTFWLWITGLSALILAAFCWMSDAAVRRSLEQGVDEELATRAVALATHCEWEERIGGVELDREEGEALLQGTATLGGGVEIRLLPDGRLLSRAGGPVPAWNPDRLPTLASNSEAPAFSRRFRAVGERRLCILRAHLPAAEEEGEEAKPGFEVLVRVSAGTRIIETSLGRFRRRLAILSVGVFALVILSGAYLSRRFLVPLRRLEFAADELREGRRETMPKSGNGDEIDRLAERLDGAFSALRTSLEQTALFTSNAAHELRNPIAVIRNAAEVALSPGRSPEERRELLGDVRTTAQELGELVEALLTLARLRPDAPATANAERIDLVEVSRSAAEVTGVRFVHDSPPVPAEIHGHRILLHLLVRNLLENAHKHGGGPEGVVLAIEAAEGSVRLSVRDRGPGIDPEERARVLEPFARGRKTAPGQEGAGLGLSLVAAVARYHQADLLIEDAGPGTRIVVRFPTTESE